MKIMNRRGFFKRIAGVVAGVITLPSVVKSKSNPSSVFIQKKGNVEMVTIVGPDDQVDEEFLREMVSEFQGRIFAEQMHASPESVGAE
jgi:hypothetical protein